MRLVEDPYGELFGSARMRKALALLVQYPRVGTFVLQKSGLVFDLVCWMQLRTRVIDDALRRFYEEGGRQVILLGAGYDCRALRMSDDLPDAHFFEVDHPQTQAAKRRALSANYPARFVAFDFEHSELSTLVHALEQVGLDLTRPVLTIWEGVTMYLSDHLVDATLASVRAWSPRGSSIVFNYVDRDALRKPNARLRAIMRIVGSAGEPYRFGLAPQHLSDFLKARGFDLAQNVSEAELAERLMPNTAHRVRADKGRNVCVAHVR